MGRAAVRWVVKVFYFNATGDKCVTYSKELSHQKAMSSLRLYQALGYEAGLSQVPKDSQDAHPLYSRVVEAAAPAAMRMAA